MNFEDRLRAQMQAAEKSAPGHPLDWGQTIDRARRSRRRYVATLAVAAAVVVAAATASVLALTGESGPDRRLSPIGPHVTESPASEATTPALEETPPAPAETPSRPPVTCSAADMSALPVQQDGLAPAAAETRRRILELAVACDYEGLEALALEGRDFFSFSIVGEGTAAQYWRRAERGGEPVMANLVTVMNVDYKVTEGFDDIDRIFVWPSAAHDPTEEDWQKVIDSGLMTAEEVQDMKEVGYIWWRGQITRDGDWISFVAGD